MTIPLTSRSGAGASKTHDATALHADRLAITSAAFAHPHKDGGDRTQRILVIDGGPAGVVSLQSLSAQKESGTSGIDAVLYERKEQVTGVCFLDQTHCNSSWLPATRTRGP